MSNFTNLIIPTIPAPSIHSSNYSSHSLYISPSHQQQHLKQFSLLKLFNQSHLMGSSNMYLVLSLSLGLFLFQGTLGELICERLPQDLCAFAIASSGKRCLLENYETNGKTEYQCRTSEVIVDRMNEWIQSDECVSACGLDRKAVGISSDSLMEPAFTAKLCGSSCFNNCPNIIDLYFNLAAGEGVFLPNLCEVQHTNPHRAMLELLSSGMAAGPASSTGSWYATSPSYSEDGASAPVSSNDESWSAGAPAPEPASD